MINLLKSLSTALLVPNILLIAPLPEVPGRFSWPSYDLY